MHNSSLRRAILSLSACLSLAATLAAAPTVVQTCTNSTFGGTSATCSFGSAVASGDVIVVIEGAISVAPSTPSASGCSLTWTAIDTDAAGTGGYGGYGSFLATAAGGCSTITVAESATGTYRINVIGYDMSGVTATLDAHALQAVTSAPSTFATPSITTIVAGDLVLGAFYEANNSQTSASTVSAPFVKDADYTCCGGAYFGGVAHDVQAASGAISATWSNGGAFSDPVWVETIALEPTGGAPAKTCTLALMGAGPC